eukprot:1613373-Pleurochrysis_carterae.AAC.2
MSPPGAAGSANGVRPENFKESPHHSRAVVARRLWSATSRTRGWNARRRPATLSACCAVGLPPSHSSALVVPSTPVSCNCSARRATLSAQARSAPAACSNSLSVPPARAVRRESALNASTACCAHAPVRTVSLPPHLPPVAAAVACGAPAPVGEARTARGASPCLLHHAGRGTVGPAAARAPAGSCACRVAPEVTQWRASLPPRPAAASPPPLSPPAQRCVADRQRRCLPQSHPARPRDARCTHFQARAASLSGHHPEHARVAEAVGIAIRLAGHRYPQPLRRLRARAPQQPPHLRARAGRRVERRRRWVAVANGDGGAGCPPAYHRCRRRHCPHPEQLRRRHGHGGQLPLCPRLSLPLRPCHGAPRQHAATSCGHHSGTSQTTPGMSAANAYPPTPSTPLASVVQTRTPSSAAPGNRRRGASGTPSFARSSASAIPSSASQSACAVPPAAALTSPRPPASNSALHPSSAWTRRCTGGPTACTRDVTEADLRAHPLCALLCPPACLPSGHRSTASTRATGSPKAVTGSPTTTLANAAARRAPPSSPPAQRRRRRCTQSAAVVAACSVPLPSLSQSAAVFAACAAPSSPPAQRRRRRCTQSAAV